MDRGKVRECSRRKEESRRIPANVGLKKGKKKSMERRVDDEMSGFDGG